MNSYIGIDLGTSAVKLLLMAADGSVLKAISRSYPCATPKPGWSEQHPEDWYRETMAGLHDLLEGQNKQAVQGLSFGGQMHGLVLLDAQDHVIRPAILWNDGRTGAETDYLNNVIGREKLTACTGNIAFAGFTAPKLLWLQKHEPENFRKIEKVMLPKDYLCYRLTGVHCTDPSDASGMLLFDVKNRCWSEEMIRICGIRREMLPRVYESYEAVGLMKPELAAELGLEAVIVAAGAGDNAAAAIGTGCTQEGQCNISLGTSGTVFIPMEQFHVDGANALHSFAHANGKYHLMGCILSAASCGKWWLEDILGTEDYDSEQTHFTTDGENHVYFLPYLSGERSPHNDVNARGVFWGMRKDTTRSEMTQAVYEGVSFALRDCLEVAWNVGVCPETVTLCGGGAKSAKWRQILADVLDTEILIPEAEEGPALGGAMLAAVACGEYENVEVAGAQLVKFRETVSPNRSAAERYEQRYQFFQNLYPVLRELFHRAAELEKS